MDKMSFKDIILVGVPDVSIVLIFGLFLCRSDFFKDRKRHEIIYKFIFSVAFVLTAIIYTRSKVDNIMHVMYISAIAYAACYKFVWGLNIRMSILNGLMVVFFSSSIENVLSPVLISASKYANIFTQSRVAVSMPVRVIQMIIILCIYTLRINIGQIPLFTETWTKMKLSKKLSTIILILFVFVSYTVAGAYTDIMIKQAVYNLHVEEIQTSINHIYYAVILLTIFGLIIISRTKRYEEFREIEFVFSSLPREELFRNFLQASSTEDVEKYKSIWNEIILKGGGKEYEK